MRVRQCRFLPTSPRDSNARHPDKARCMNIAQASSRRFATTSCCRSSALTDIQRPGIDEIARCSSLRERTSRAGCVQSVSAPILSPASYLLSPPTSTCTDHHHRRRPQRSGHRVLPRAPATSLSCSKARSMVGGAAVTEEIAPGSRCPTLAHSTGPLRPSIAADMQLARRVEFLRPDPRLVALSPDGRPSGAVNDVARSTEAIRRIRPRRRALSGVRRRAGALGAFLLRLLEQTPPSSINPAPGNLGAAEDRTAVSASWAGPTLPAAPMDADGRGRSRRRMVHRRSAAGRRRLARHLRRRGWSVVRRHGRGAADERGDRSRCPAAARSP